MKCKDSFQLSLFIQRIRSTFLPTGSRIIGGHTEESDWDFVATIEQVKELAEEIQIDTEMLKKKEKYAGSFLSLKYRDSEKDSWTNLIIVQDDIDLIAWDFATEQLKRSPSTVFGPPDRRKAVFGWCLNSFYLSNNLPERAIWSDPITD